MNVGCWRAAIWSGSGWRSWADLPDCALRIATLWGNCPLWRVTFKLRSLRLPNLFVAFHEPTLANWWLTAQPPSLRGASKLTGAGVGVGKSEVVAVASVGVGVGATISAACSAAGASG